MNVNEHLSNVTHIISNKILNVKFFLFSMGEFFRIGRGVSSSTFYPIFLTMHNVEHLISLFNH